MRRYPKATMFMSFKISTAETSYMTTEKGMSGRGSLPSRMPLVDQCAHLGPSGYIYDLYKSVGLELMLRFADGNMSSKRSSTRLSLYILINYSRVLSFQLY